MGEAADAGRLARVRARVRVVERVRPGGVLEVVVQQPEERAGAVRGGEPGARQKEVEKVEAPVKVHACERLYV